MRVMHVMLSAAVPERGDEDGVGPAYLEDWSSYYESESEPETVCSESDR